MFSQYEDKYVEELESDLSKLREQLAKANESVSKLEKYLRKTEESLISACDDTAKANERVVELERELKESDEDLGVTQQQSSQYENALEEVQAVFVDSDACPLFEPFNANNLSNWLNKCAINKKIEGARCYASYLHDAGLTGVWDAFDSVCEQLRKEQNNV